ncbi:NADH-quinone oxidoreductase subunit C [Fibrobacter sp.]|uniref:NADH-quinone oxidoreductase subunit C n=1 Tax=Fibrobacter sp. TaxID=35828 RepID=UPI0025C40D98|nr:NADH-quinone oxidoreductase subunit C [Fibrobacter sp.]MCI6436285.1 NADH-quinone oxidoreductase subunit C [Fibrobacter sp.]MDD7498093.1 NADH-quinone oxidoreductase subunit C [Fibrobacter sp.]MDY5724797.1 NADH-quinone oxidoreductase subunit C [Fibrobacter sp.]
MMEANEMTFAETVVSVLTSKFGGKKDDAAKWDACVVVPKEYLHNAVEFLKNDPSMQFDMLLDLAGIDYLTYPNHEGPRFAVSYAFKCMKNPGRRVRLKVLVSEADLKVTTITDLYASANWLEREVYDQFGIVFEGHPDLRRILNHVEFVGHPLRKDYPAQKRQWLSTTDFLIPELEKRLEDKGYKVIQRSKEIMPVEEEYLEGSIRE